MKRHQAAPNAGLPLTLPYTNHNTANPGKTMPNPQNHSPSTNDSNSTIPIQSANPSHSTSSNVTNYPSSFNPTNSSTYVQKWKYKAPAPEEEKKQKKEMSNAVKKVKERQRRGRMTDSIEMLRAIIPDCQDQKKVNQSAVMELAVKHIQGLEKKITELETMVAELSCGEPTTKRQKRSDAVPNKSRERRHSSDVTMDSSPDPLNISLDSFSVNTPPDFSMNTPPGFSMSTPTFDAVAESSGRTRIRDRSYNVVEDTMRDFFSSPLINLVEVLYIFWFLVFILFLRH